MKKCPNCGEFLFNVNSSSSELECLAKTCSYSTVSRVGIEIDAYEENSYLNLIIASKKQEETDKLKIAP